MEGLVQFLVNEKGFKYVYPTSHMPSQLSKYSSVRTVYEKARRS